jgi:FAD/FMN-containing dehydrogenase
MVFQVSSIVDGPRCALPSSPDDPPDGTRPRMADRMADRGTTEVAPSAGIPAEMPAQRAPHVFGIRLVSARSPEEACRRWRELRESHPDLLGSLAGAVDEPPVVCDGAPSGRTAVADATPSVVWHVQALPFARLHEAVDLCRALRRERVPCVIIRRI